MDYPIGILDSSSGGLTIWKEIVSLLPDESTVYIGDHLHMPYSKKTTSYIQKRVLQLIQFLIQQHAKLIVIACNTGTVAGIDLYRKKFPNMPIIGIVPVIKTAVQQSHTRRITVLSTEYTSKSTYQKNLIRQFAQDCIVKSIGSTRLVSLIETGDLSGEEIAGELSHLLKKTGADGTDVLVLGCTHFPFVRDQIRAIVGEGVVILDSGGAVARQTKRILDQESLHSRAGHPTHAFYTTGNAENISRTVSRLLKKTIKIHHVTV